MLGGSDTEWEQTGWPVGVAQLVQLRGHLTQPCKFGDCCLFLWCDTGRDGNPVWTQPWELESTF